MFNGDISRFSPADLLLFLTHLGKEGVLTVRRGDEILSLSFKDGGLIAAHSELVEGKVLAQLRLRRIVGEEILTQAERACRETGLPLAQVLENSEDLEAAKVGAVLKTGIMEALFQLFLWESGEFQFTEIAVDPNPFHAPCDCQGLAMDITRQVDEYREILRTVGSLELAANVTGDGLEMVRGDAELDSAVRYVLARAKGIEPMHELLVKSPLTSFETLRAVAKATGQGWLELAEPRQAKASAEVGPAAVADDGDASFQAYKRSLRRMLSAGDLASRLRELLDFCRGHFDHTLMIAAREGAIVRTTRFDRDRHGRITSRDQRNPGVRLNCDPIIQRVCQGGTPFFGRVFPSHLLQALGAEFPAGDCAVLPLGSVNGGELLIYATRAGENGAPEPFQYMELLSWQICPPAAKAQPAAASETSASDLSAAAPDAPEKVLTADQKLKAMVSSISELPPMPHMAARILDLLGNPDCQMSDLTEALSSDPALVARILKVSNSSLYSGGQEASSLQAALVRLGNRTTRNLVVAASTRSLFPTDKTRVGMDGKALWQHSVECGLAARRVAESLGYADPDEAFVAGVLHDIGKLIILLNQPDEFRRSQRLRESGNLTSVEAEQRVLGFDHCDVGGRLLESWGMPRALGESVQNHHDPAAAQDGGQLARIVALGNALSHQYGGLAGGEEAEADFLLRLESPGLDQRLLESLAEQVTEDFAHSGVLD